MLEEIKEQLEEAKKCIKFQEKEIEWYKQELFLLDLEKKKFINEIKNLKFIN